MRADFRIIDADRHAMEPMDLWRNYLPDALKHKAPYLETLELSGSPQELLEQYGPKALLPQAPSLMLEGRTVWNTLGPRSQIEMSWASRKQAAETEAVAMPTGHLEAMDRSGVDIAFLYPTLSLYLLGVDTLDPALGAAFARAYNDWLYDYCRSDPQRLKGVGILCTHDPQAMCEEAQRLSGLGFKALTFLPNPVRGRRLCDPAYEPLWSLCEHLSMAVAIHAGTHARLSTIGADRFDSHFGRHACAHPMEQMVALLTLIEGGVLEHHPKLRIGFLESGCGWLPYWLYRLDEIEYAHYSGEVSDRVKQKPSQYFKRQCFVAIEPDEPYLPALIEFIGADNLLFGTDYPHGDHGDDIVDKALMLSDRLPQETLRKLLWDNAARFYGLEADIASPKPEPKP